MRKDPKRLTMLKTPLSVEFRNALHAMLKLRTSHSKYQKSPGNANLIRLLRALKRTKKFYASVREQILLIEESLDDDYNDLLEQKEHYDDDGE